MSETAPTQPSERKSSLLQSDALFRIFGGDAMQALRCGICMEFFEVPIVLPCGHTFCLHCLTDMCKHASQSAILCPIQDLRISCPQCRVLIYASPILDRNVTHNLVIQSLIECLRVRPAESKQHKSVNTDEARVGPKIRLVGDLELDQIIQDVDRLKEAISKKNNVLDLAYFEVDEIRREHLSTDLSRRRDGDEKQWMGQPPWKSASTSNTPAMKLGLSHQQKQLQHLIQQQQSFQQQQYNQLNHQHQHLPFQQRALRSNNWSAPTANQSLHHAAPSSSSSSRFVSSASSLMAPTSSMSSLPTATVSVASCSASTCLRQNPKTHCVLPAHQRQMQFQRHEQLQQSQQQQQPKTLQQQFYVKRQLNLIQFQQRHQQQNQPLLLPREEPDKKQTAQQQHDQEQQQQQQLLQLNQSFQALQHPSVQLPHPLSLVLNQQPQHHHQHQQLHISQASTSRMAAVLPLQRLRAPPPPPPTAPPVTDPLESIGAPAQAPLPLPLSSNHPLALLQAYPSRLDNDPAIMAYTYRAAASQATPTSAPK